MLTDSLYFIEQFPSNVLNILHLYPIECTIGILTGVLYIILASTYRQFIIANINFYKEFIGSFSCSFAAVNIYCFLSIVFIILSGVCDLILYYFIGINKEAFLFLEISKVIALLCGIYTIYNVIIKPIFSHTVEVKVNQDKVS